METLKQQFRDMANKGIIPVFEFSHPNGKFTVVDFSASDDGLVFEFETEGKGAYFSGDVIKAGDDVFLVEWDEYFLDLHHYLEKVHDEMTEGFFIPNGMEWE